MIIINLLRVKIAQTSKGSAKIVKIQKARHHFVESLLASTLVSLRLRQYYTATADQSQLSPC